MRGRVLETCISISSIKISEQGQANIVNNLENLNT